MEYGPRPTSPHPQYLEPPFGLVVLLLPLPPKMDRGYVFTLSVCLSVGEDDISNSCGQIWTKFGGQVGVTQGRIGYILVNIQIQTPEFFK